MKSDIARFSRALNSTNGSGNIDGVKVGHQRLKCDLVLSIGNLLLDVLKSLLDVVDWNKCKSVQHPAEVSDTFGCLVGGCEAEVL